MAALLFVLPAILIIILPRAALTADGSNFLLSDQILPTDGRLTYDNFDFIMQGDCNLVLYKGWQSNTANRGKNCTLTLNNRGQLIIKTGSGYTVWTSSSPSQDGKYAAVLHPEGKVVVYGPAVWSTHSLSSVNVNGRVVPLVANTPLVNNVLFSGQVLYDDGKLVNREYTFVMQGDCNLVLYGGNWQSNTHGKGKFCFLRLDHQGTLTIKDDDYNTVWTSGPKSQQGHYVLILQDDGRAVVYGYDIWSTKPLDTVVTGAEGIAMVIGKK